MVCAAFWKGTTVTACWSQSALLLCYSYQDLSCPEVPSMSYLRLTQHSSSSLMMNFVLVLPQLVLRAIQNCKAAPGWDSLASVEQVSTHKELQHFPLTLEEWEENNCTVGILWETIQFKKKKIKSSFHRSVSLLPQEFSFLLLLFIHKLDRKRTSS